MITILPTLLMHVLIVNVFGHDVNSDPYYDVSNESYARLNAMIEIMNERHEHLVSDMREFGLLHKTDTSLHIPRLKFNLYDDHESLLPLESNVVDDAPLTNIEEVFDHPLSSLPLVAPSLPRTPVSTNVRDSTSLASALPLAQCIGVRDG